MEGALYPDDPTILTSNFIRLNVDSYDLEVEMKDKLCLQYVTYIRGEKQMITLGENDFLLTKEVTEENGTVRQLTIEDLSLYQTMQLAQSSMMMPAAIPSS